MISNNNIKNENGTSIAVRQTVCEMKQCIRFFTLKLVVALSFSNVNHPSR